MFNDPNTLSNMGVDPQLLHQFSPQAVLERLIPLQLPARKLPQAPQ
jgi:hypothetical protein